MGLVEVGVSCGCGWLGWVGLGKEAGSFQEGEDRGMNRAANPSPTRKHRRPNPPLAAAARNVQERVPRRRVPAGRRGCHGQRREVLLPAGAVVRLQRLPRGRPAAAAGGGRHTERLQQREHRRIRQQGGHGPHIRAHVRGPRSRRTAAAVARLIERRVRDGGRHVAPRREHRRAAAAAAEEHLGRKVRRVRTAGHGDERAGAGLDCVIHKLPAGQQAARGGGLVCSCRGGRGEVGRLRRVGGGAVGGVGVEAAGWGFEEGNEAGVLLKSLGVGQELGGLVQGLVLGRGRVGWMFGQLLVVGEKVGGWVCKRHCTHTSPVTMRTHLPRLPPHPLGGRRHPRRPAARVHVHPDDGAPAAFIRIRSGRRLAAGVEGLAGPLPEECL
jgi:hypothetical protein